MIFCLDKIFHAPHFSLKLIKDAWPRVSHGNVGFGVVSKKVVFVGYADLKNVLETWQNDRKATGGMRNGKSI